MNAARDLETLQQAGIDDIDMLVHAAAQFVREHARAGAVTTSPLSTEEERLLRESGALGLDDTEEPSLQAGPVSIVAQYAQLVAGASSTETVARCLGVVPSRVRQRVAERSLYALDTPAGRVFPTFQFDESGATLPGLGHVLAAIDPSTHPITVERFFFAPTADLESTLVTGALSPRDWLLAALPVDDVVMLARDL